MKNILSDINGMLSITDSYQAPERIMNLLFGEEKNESRYSKTFWITSNVMLVTTGSMNILKTNTLIGRITSRILLLNVFQLWSLNY